MRLGSLFQTTSIYTDLYIFILAGNHPEYKHTDRNNIKHHEACRIGFCHIIQVSHQDRTNCCDKVTYRLTEPWQFNRIFICTSIVPTTSHVTFGIMRIISPLNNSNIPANNIILMPIFPLIFATNGDTMPNIMSGIVVNPPSIVWFNDKVFPISEIIGPITVNGARNVAATTITAVSNKNIDLCLNSSNPFKVYDNQSLQIL